MKIFISILSLVCSNICIAQQSNSDIYAGNKLYANGQYKEAAVKYQKAYTEKKYKDAQYNLGNAIYQQKDFESAAKQYAEVARNAQDVKLKSASNHNIGNTLLEQKKWNEAIQYYKQSLKQNPTSQDTKYNLAYAQAMKKNQDKQDKNKDKNKDQKDNDKDQKDKDKKEENKKDENQDKQDPNKPEDKKGEDEKPKPQPSKLSKEQADQILNALNQEEKKLKEQKEKGKGTPVKLDKDW